MKMNVSSPKVVIPSALFALLSPGLILQVPEKVPFMSANAFSTMKTSRISVFFHALVFMVVYKIIAKMRGIVLKPADLLVPAFLFMILSPGVLLSIPGNGGKIFGPSDSTGYAQIVVHAIVFALVFSFLRTAFPQLY